MRPNLLVAVLALAAASAFAQAPQQPFFNVITLEASATADVPTDTLTVTLFVEEQGPDPGQLAARVNARLEEALAKARKEPKVEAHSGNYQTNPTYDRANQITGWRIRADVVLESRDFKAVAALAGRLQPALKLWSMTFSLSRARARRPKRRCSPKRSANSRRRRAPSPRASASRVTCSGRSSCAATAPRLPGPVAYRGVAMSAMADAAPPAPVPVEGGKNAVTVNVSGSVVLGPGK